MAGLRVLIVGASIAGPATAYWLSKAGARITIIERFPSLREGGQAIDIRVCGVSVMRKMHGMEERVRAQSTQEEGVSFIRPDGRPYGVIRMTGNPDRQSLISEYEIYRGDLSKILVDLPEQKSSIDYIFGEEVASIRYEGDKAPVTVEFKNGTARSEFDLVIGCDGSFSRTRAMALGCGVRDHVIPTRSWAAYYSIPKDLCNGSKIGVGISAVGGRTISIGSDRFTESTRVALFANPPSSPSSSSSSAQDPMRAFREALSEGQDHVKLHIANRFRGMGWITDELLQGMMDSKDFYASEIVQVKAPSIFDRRVVLVGDAGYAAGPTGGGTSLALTGAYVLAGSLFKYPGDIDAALAEYEQVMRPIITELQKIPPFVNTIMAPQTAWGIWLRNHLFALIAWTGVAEFLGTYFAAGFSDSKKFPLPDYDWDRKDTIPTSR
ncbi:hypothetical protein BD324DRAFT_650701 [Kockovaella imperatae]|uniref:FAD-binding domain-containing protein n=1 Tax=Kockovaella imperatae TaxID=4999 RepID=A0A1Y1UHW8_9TREE|nr:hypothetical protein BD324DRAFT_650701 [Kockovaella imperatae]ORX37086.1 hypothetical protein BD324DRAFT_650701 [Kockovaella imperatae]